MISWPTEGEPARGGAPGEPRSPREGGRARPPGGAPRAGRAATARAGRRASVAFALALGACTALASPSARADQPAPSAERIKAAAEEFDRGRRAYLAKEFEQAAGHFENAFRDAPSKETLRLAIRARRDANQPARAATLAAIAREKYASDAPTVDLADETLEATAPLVTEYLVECSDPCAVAADGRVVSYSDATRHRVFLDPGARDVGVSFPQGGSSSKAVAGERGGSVSLSFERPAPPPAEPPPAQAPPAAAVTAPAPPGAARSERPFGPAVFWFGAVLSVAGGAATVASGLHMMKDPGPDAVRRECVGQGLECPLYQRGRQAQLRTNVLLGSSIGVAALTGIIGLFLTEWSSSPAAAGAVHPPLTIGSTQLSVLPTGVSGRF